MRFLKYAKGSSGELRNKLYVLQKANFIDELFYTTTHKRLIDLSKSISGFIKYLKVFEKKK